MNQTLLQAAGAPAGAMEPAGAMGSGGPGGSVEAGPPMPMINIVDFISFYSPVFRAYAMYTGILVVKLAIMPFLTTFQRYKNKVYLI